MPLVSLREPDPTGAWRIGVDIGGTFTDLALLGPDRALHVLKVATVPNDPSGRSRNHGCP
ncbi:MAG TPA: hydantoinase/oxoprolinase N-terminal domain-containing protein [Casimicrobiaceae bacterium]